MGKDLPAVIVGDRIKVHWPNNDGSTDRITAIVISIEECKKVKQNSLYKYTLRVQNMDQEVDRSTRLLHLEWKKVSNKQKRSESIVTIPEINSEECLPTKKRQKKLLMSNGEETVENANSSKSSSTLPAHSRIVAPMVGGSELAFRLLCRYLVFVGNV
jgi:sortase (surface protein transpeptidase)